MKKIAYIVLTVVLLFGLVVGGCQSAEVVPVAAEGGVINLYGIDPLTLDPAITGEMTSHQYITHIFGGLVRLDDNLEPAPDIAREWEVSDDGRTYTFYLRNDVKFHNGREVKAADFKYSWERACAPATGSQTAPTYLNDIVGAREVLAGKSKELSGVKVVADDTLAVTIDAPKAYFLSKLTYPTAYVVDRDNVTSGDGWWHHPNGTGPFILKQWAENELLVMERNELYYGDKASVDKAVFHLWAGVPFNLYETDEIDAADVNLLYIDKAMDTDGPFHQELEVVPELSFYYLGFNSTQPPFDDVNIRRAFSMAVDKEKLASLVYRGMVQPADGILPPGMPGFNKDVSGLTFDVAKARELIAGSKYGDVSRLPPIVMTASGWGGLISPEVEAVIEEWRRNLGVEVTVRQLEPLQFLYHLKTEKDNVYYMGWIADYPHPQDFLEILFYTGGENNYGEYSNPEVDDLLARGGVEMDSDLSLELYRQAEQKLVDDAACIPLWFGRNHVVVKPHVKGYKLDAMGLVQLNEVSVGN